MRHLLCAWSPGPGATGLQHTLRTALTFHTSSWLWYHSQEGVSCCNKDPTDSGLRKVISPTSWSRRVGGSSAPCEHSGATCLPPGFHWVFPPFRGHRWVASTFLFQFVGRKVGRRMRVPGFTFQAWRPHGTAVYSPWPRQAEGRAHSSPRQAAARAPAARGGVGAASSQPRSRLLPGVSPAV